MRRAKYAGSFYPADGKELSEMIDSLLKENKPTKKFSKIRGAVVPHAGYAYSGPVAATAYNAIKESSPKKVVLIGPSHQAYLMGAYSFAQPWETPLGIVRVEKVPRINAIEDDAEHSLEVQVPFLQKVLGEGFALVPIIYGGVSAEELAGLVAPLAGRGTVLLASSDLCHYLQYKEANHTDKATINFIVSLKVKKFLENGDACGKTGIAALMILAKKLGWKAHLLDYRNSGDTSGIKEQVVGYASIIFTE